MDNQDKISYFGALSQSIIKANQQNNVVELRILLQQLAEAVSTPGDISCLIGPVVKLLPCHNLEVKKTIYSILPRICSAHPDTALLIANTLNRDIRDPNPTVKCLAITALVSIRPLHQDHASALLTVGLNDGNPKVRLASVVGCAKVHHTSPELIQDDGFVDRLYALIRDADPNVVSSCLIALDTILASEGGVVINRSIAWYLLKRLAEFPAPQLATVLQVLCKYLPDDEAEIFRELSTISKSSKLQMKTTASRTKNEATSTYKLQDKGPFPRQLCSELRSADQSTTVPKSITAVKKKQSILCTREDNIYSGVVVISDSEEDLNDEDKIPYVTRATEKNPVEPATIIIDSSDEEIVERTNVRQLHSPSDGSTDRSSKSEVQETNKDFVKSNLIIPESSEDSNNEDVFSNGVKDLLPKAHMTEAARKDIQHWLASSEQTCRVKAKLTEKRIAKTDKKVTIGLNRSVRPDTLLTELYGIEWHSAKKKISSDSNSTTSSDNFEKFLQKYGPRTKRQFEESPARPKLCEDFINDGDVSENSMEFYHAVLTHDNHGESASKNVEMTARRLSFLHLDDDNNKFESDSAKTNITHSVSKPPIHRVIQKTAVQPSPVFKVPKTTNTPNLKVGKENVDANFCTPKRSFMESLSAHTPVTFCDAKAQLYRSNFKAKKEQLSRELFNMFNEKVFKYGLPSDIQIDWNVRLLKTAGYCYNKRIPGPDGTKLRTSRIELSTKVCDSAERLRDTLIHELCHAAVWIISGVTGGHGPQWKAWTAKANKLFPEIPSIERCHRYDIETKFTYRCTCCGYSIGRQSRSIDISAKRCGFCYGVFELINNSAKSKTVTKTPKPVNGFALYVKENYSSVKGTTTLKHGDIMKLLGQKFSASKSK